MAAGFAKCYCQHCNGHIEFETAHAGRTIACPHCELDTVLFIPGAHRAPVLFPKKKKRAVPWTTFGVVLLVVLLIGAVVVAALRPDSKGAQALGAWAGLTGTTLMGVLMAAGVVICLLTVILWIIFPVFMYFHTKKTNELLEKIERNTRAN